MNHVRGKSACVSIVVSDPINIEKSFQRVLTYAFENRISRMSVSIYAPWHLHEWVPYMREGISSNLYITICVSTYNDIERVVKNLAQCPYEIKLLVCDGESAKRVESLVKELPKRVEVLMV